MAAASATPADEDVVVDFYVWCPDGMNAHAEEQAAATALLDGAKVSRRIRRVGFALAGPGSAGAGGRRRGARSGTDGP